MHFLETLSEEKKKKMKYRKGPALDPKFHLTADNELQVILKDHRIIIFYIFFYNNQDYIDGVLIDNRYYF